MNCSLMRTAGILTRGIPQIVVLSLIGTLVVAGKAQATPIQIYNSVTGAYSATSVAALSNGVLAGQSASENLLGVGFATGLHLGAYRTPTNGLIQYDLLTGLVVGSASTAILSTSGPDALDNDPVGAPSGGDFLDYANNGSAGLAVYNVGGATHVYNAFTGAYIGPLASTLSGGPLNGNSAGAPAGGIFLGYGNDGSQHYDAYNAGGKIEIYLATGAYLGAHASSLTGGPLSGQPAGNPAGYYAVGWGIQSSVAYVYFVPEPSSIAMLLFGGVTLSYVRRKRVG